MQPACFLDGAAVFAKRLGSAAPFPERLLAAQTKAPSSQLEALRGPPKGNVVTFASSKAVFQAYWKMCVFLRK